MKTSFSIEEYSFGQTTLEQVFIKFAKDQEIEEEYEDSYGIGISVCDKCWVIWEQRQAQPSVPINLRSVGNGQDGKYVSPIFSEINDKIYFS